MQLCILGCASDKCQSEVATRSSGSHSVLDKGVPGIACGFAGCQFYVRSADPGLHLCLSPGKDWMICHVKYQGFLAYSSSFFLAVLEVVPLERKMLKYCSFPQSWRDRGISGHRSSLTLKSPKPHLIWQLAPLPSNRVSPLPAPATHLPCAGLCSYSQSPGKSPQGTDQAKIAYVLTPQQG